LLAAASVVALLALVWLFMCLGGLSFGWLTRPDWQNWVILLGYVCAPVGAVVYLTFGSINLANGRHLRSSALTLFFAAMILVASAIGIAESWWAFL